LATCKEAGLPTLTFHDLRRLAATALVAEGVDVKTAQTRLGLSSPQITLALYAQATGTGDRDAARRVGQRLMNVARDGRAMDSASVDSASNTYGPAQEEWSGANKNRTCDLSIIRLTTLDYLEPHGTIIPVQRIGQTDGNGVERKGTRDKRGMKGPASTSRAHRLECPEGEHGGQSPQ